MKVNDKVMIVPTSKYYGDGSESNPINEVGTIIKIQNDGYLDIIVEWDNGQENSYDVWDLKLV
jgi:hypothetical protein